MRNKHRNIEEPCDGKLSSTVLKTSGIGDSLAEFNQQIRTQYIQPQLTNVASNWSDRYELGKQRWQQTGGNALLHDWAIAAYYRFQSNIDRLDWLQELILIWVTASINTNLTDTATATTRIRDLISSIVDRFPDPTVKSELQLEWQRELMAVEWFGTPPTTGLRIRGVFISPGFYDLFKSQMAQIQLPEKLWAMLYTPWWRSVVTCQQGNSVRAMVYKPTDPPDSVASQLAQKFVAYHEGCYYLDCRLGGFPRWREAFRVLELAKVQIRQSSTWQSTLRYPSALDLESHRPIRVCQLLVRSAPKRQCEHISKFCHQFYSRWLPI